MLIALGSEVINRVHQRGTTGTTLLVDKEHIPVNFLGVDSDFFLLPFSFFQLSFLAKIFLFSHFQQTATVLMLRHS